MASVVVSPIITSLKLPCVMPSISSRKRMFRKGSVRVAMLSSCAAGSADGGASALRLAGFLEDPEDDELGRAHRRDADLADEAAVQDVVLCHRRAVTANGEGLVLGDAQQRAVAPLRPQE